jgi:SAM-dependent methyltransferase
MCWTRLPTDRARQRETCGGTLVRRVRASARIWDRRTDSWHHQVSDSPALRQVRDRVVALADIGPDDTAVDLGSGTGFLTLQVATRARQVIGVDVSKEMAGRLGQEARERGIHNVRPVVADLAEFDLPAGSVDVAVSMYALHHLADRDKRELARRIAGWLRPGGRVVIGDMMFGRGMSRRDRQILSRKLRLLAKQGPGGLWRIVKNLIRLGVRAGQERPVPPDFWVAAFRAAGLREVRFYPAREEAGILTGLADGKDPRVAPPSGVDSDSQISSP